MQLFDVMRPAGPMAGCQDDIAHLSMHRDIVLIELLKQADIRNTTLFIAAQYANMFNTVWKDNPALIHQYFNTHQRELSMFIKMKMDRVVNRLLDQASRFSTNSRFLSTVELDAATAASIDNMLSELKNRANDKDISTALITTTDDLLAGKPVIRTGILTDLEIFEIAIRGNKEAYKANEQNYNWRNHPTTQLPLLITELYNTLTGIVRNVRYKSANVCYNYKEWATLLSIIYMLYTDPHYYRDFTDEAIWLSNKIPTGEGIPPEERNPYVNMFTGFTPEEAICDCGHLGVTVESYEKTHRGIRERNDNPLVKAYLQLQYAVNRANCDNSYVS